MPIEQFSRYTRLWTRGYDTYTPTRNIVFHDYNLTQINGHGNKEWFTRQKDRFRKNSITRVKTILQIPLDGTNTIASETELANLGIYGIGKRRTLKQLNEFININIQNGESNTGANLKCSGHEWVPYDGSISPTENLYNNPDNLDPQPEYILRTDLIYYQQVRISMLEDEQLQENNGKITLQKQQRNELVLDSPYDEMPSFSILAFFWIIGLFGWYLIFSSPKRKTSKQSSRNTNVKTFSNEGGKEM